MGADASGTSGKCWVRKSYGKSQKGNAEIFLKDYSVGPEDQLQHDIKGTLGEIMHLGGSKRLLY